MTSKRSESPPKRNDSDYEPVAMYTPRAISAQEAEAARRAAEKRPRFKNLDEAKAEAKRIRDAETERLRARSTPRGDE
jgi:hypothetical protein